MLLDDEDMVIRRQNQYLVDTSILFLMNQLIFVPHFVAELIFHEPEYVNEEEKECPYGIDLIMNSDIDEPINLRTMELVTIDRLVDVVESTAGLELKRKYDLNVPKGVHGRNSDNTRIRKYSNWEPETPLKCGLTKTYEWIENEYTKKCKFK